MNAAAADLGLIAVGAFLAALVIGSAGFAFAIVVTAIWIHVLPPPVLVLLAAVCAALLRATSVWRFRRLLLWLILVSGASLQF